MNLVELRKSQKDEKTHGWSKKSPKNRKQNGKIEKTKKAEQKCLITNEYGPIFFISQP